MHGPYNECRLYILFFEMHEEEIWLNTRAENVGTAKYVFWNLLQNLFVYIVYMYKIDVSEMSLRVCIKNKFVYVCTCTNYDRSMYIFVYRVIHDNTLMPTRFEAEAGACRFYFFIFLFVIIILFLLSH